MYEGEELTATDHLNEYIMTSLRTSRGIDLRHIAERFGTKHIASIEQAAEPWLASKMLIRHEDRLSIPATHFLVSDAIIESFFG